MEITLETIELVKDRTGVSYKEAKEALEATGGSVVDAIIYIEENIDLEYASRDQSAVAKIISILKEALRKGNVTKVRICKGNETILNIPVNCGLASAVLFPWAAVVTVLATIAADCRIEVIKEFGDTVDISSKTGGVYDIVRDKGGVVVDEVMEKGAAIYGTAKEKGAVIYGAAKEKGAAIYEVAKDKGGAIYEAAKDKGSDIYEAAKGKGTGIYEVAREKGSEFYEAAKDKAGNLAGRVGKKAKNMAGAGEVVFGSEEEAEDIPYEEAPCCCTAPEETPCDASAVSEGCCCEAPAETPEE